MRDDRMRRSRCASSLSPTAPQVLGVDNPQTLASRDLLAEAYFRARKVTEAIAIYERNLTDTVRVLGADHPGILTLSIQSRGYLLAGGEGD